MADVAGAVEDGAEGAVDKVKGAAADVWGKFKKLPTWAKIALAIVVVLIILLIAGVFGGGSSTPAATAATTAATDPATTDPTTPAAATAPTTPAAATQPPSGSGVGGGGGGTPSETTAPLSLGSPSGATPGTTPTPELTGAAATHLAQTVAKIIAHPTTAAQVPVTAAQKAKTPGIVTNAPQIRAPSATVDKAAGATVTKVVPSGSKAPAKKVTTVKAAPKPKPVAKAVVGTAGVRKA